MWKSVGLTGCALVVAAGAWWSLRSPNRPPAVADPQDARAGRTSGSQSEEHAEAPPELESTREVTTSEIPGSEQSEVTGVASPPAEEPIRFTGRLIELPTNHIPPDPSVFEEKYADLDMFALQECFSDLTQALSVQSDDAFTAERAAGREILMLRPIMDDPSSPEHGQSIIACPYAHRISRVSTVQGDSTMMSMMVLEPSSYPDLYDISAECAWLSSKIFSLGGKPAMTW